MEEDFQDRKLRRSNEEEMITQSFKVSEDDTTSPEVIGIS